MEVWTSSFQPEHFANVSLICFNEKQATLKQVLSIAKATYTDTGLGSAHNLSESYASGCTKISCISDIFNPGLSQDKNLTCAAPKVVLIEGGPGIGKTILSKEIAFQWACEKLLVNSHLLFLLPLYDPQISQIKSLEQLVNYGIKSTANKKPIIDYLEANSGEYCTIVFDGYEEISEEGKENSLIAKILKREYLPLCKLVITSRPSASIDLHGIMDRRVKILGFTNEDRDDYAHKNLKKHELQKFQECLQSSSYIKDLCCTPLNMTILIGLFKGYTDCDNLKLPETQIGINTRLIYATISRFISKQERKIVPIKSSDDLHTPYKKYFNSLCKLAYDLLDSNDLLGSKSVIFNDDVMKKYFPKNKTTKDCTLGLLSESSYYNVIENKHIKCYSFLNLSMQECMAAHFIAKEAETYFLKNNFWDSAYLNTGIMYVGYTEGKSQAFKNFLSGRSGSFSKQFNTNKTKVNIDDKVEKLHFFLCLLEAKNYELLDQLQINKVMYNNIIDLSDHTFQENNIDTLGFFLSKSNIKQWEKINLSNCCITDEILKNLLATFSDRKIIDVYVNTIDVSDNTLSSHSIDAIISLINLFKIQNVIISDNVTEGLEFRIALLSSAAKIEEITISSKGEGSQFLINYKCNKMEQNMLNQLEFKRQLYAWNVNIPLLTASNLIAKCNMINVYHEDLHDEEIDDTAIKIKAICEERSKIVTYVLQSKNKIIAYKAESYQLIQSIANSAFSKGNSGPKTVDIRQCCIGDENFPELKQVFCQHIKHFDKLIISKCSLTSSSTPMILEILKFCIINHLIVYEDVICDVVTHDFISIETAEIKNFELHIPLIVTTTKDSKAFFVNCIFNDSVLLKGNDFVKSQLNFINIELNETNIQSFLKFCRFNTHQINAADIKMTNEIVDDVFAELKRLPNNMYILVATKRLIACRMKQEMIMEAISNNPDITTLELINCELNFSKFYPLGKLLSSLQKWKTINFAGCNIGDEGCLSLYECFTANKRKNIEILDLSSNCLSSQSIVAILKFLEFCVIKTLIISENDIQVYRFNKELHMYLLAKKILLNFSNKIPLLVYESHPPHKICNVYAFKKSEGDFLLHVNDDNTLYNLYQVQLDENYFFDWTFSILATSSTIKVFKLVEGAMNERIRDVIIGLTNFKYELSKVDFSRIPITDESCVILCNSLFNDKSSLNIIEEIDFSSQKFSLNCASTIIESLQYCIIKHLIMPSMKVLDKISETILKDFHTGKSIFNFIERIPLTINIETEVEENEEDGITYAIVANTYLQNYEINEELFNHYNNLVINQITTSHTFVLLECLNANTLNNILSILYTKLSYVKICIFEIRLTDDVLEASINHLKTLKKRIYRDRLQYVLASDSKIVAYNVKRFHIVQALQIKPKICDLEIAHCVLSKNRLKTIALSLFGTFHLLKNIRVKACNIKDNDFFEFCDIMTKMSIHLKTIDFSYNCLTSSCIGSILKLLQCCVIEKLVVSNNCINDKALSDAIFQLARYKWEKVCNFNLSIPVVVINAPIMQQCKLMTDKNKYVNIFHMNCKIDENLLIEYNSKTKKIYFLNSLVAVGDLSINLSKLQHHLCNTTKIFVYEKNLNDELVQKAALCLINAQMHVSFILSSSTKLLSNRTSYHQIAPILDSNTLINNLQVTNFEMQFPKDCRFIRALNNTSRIWEMIDFSGSNICDRDCLDLQHCFIASRSAVKHLNLMKNNLSSVSAVAVANIILACNVERINICYNKLQNIEVINALNCLLKQSGSSVSAEIISLNCNTIIMSNVDPKLQLWSLDQSIQLSVMHYDQCNVHFILSSFNNINLSKVIMYNNSLTLEQIEAIIEKFSRTDLCIEEAYMQYNCKLIDYSFESLMNELLKLTKDDRSLPSFSSLSFSVVDRKLNKICMYDKKIVCSSVEDTLTKFTRWQLNETLVAFKVSNCLITSNIAMELASIINKITELKLFEISYNHITESDLKVIIKALQSTRSLIFFSIKSIDCFIGDTAKDIASIITRNNAIEYLEISNCDMKQSAVLKIAKSVKELGRLKLLNLRNIALTCEALQFALKNKSLLEELNLSRCNLYNSEIVIISNVLNEMKLNSIDLSYNCISNYAIDALKVLFSNRFLCHVDMSHCNLQEEGISCMVEFFNYKSLKYLDFSGNRITDTIAAKLSAIIENNPFIAYLDLSNCSLQQQGIVEILTSLSEHAFHLKSFKINSLPSNEEIVSCFECLLDNNKSIENLTLQECNCVEIFNAIRKKLSSMQALDISSSKILFQNLICIIANNINLKHLNISNCDLIGELDVVDNGISGPFIEYISVGNNKMTKIFVKYITNLIENNSRIQHMEMANCEIQEIELLHITNSLTFLTNLNHLNCSNIVISQQVANNIAKIIINNVYLEHLNISSCYLTDQTFSPIVNALKQLQGLKYLNMSFNYITLDETSIRLSENLLCGFSDKAIENTKPNDHHKISVAGRDNDLLPLHSSNENSQNNLPRPHHHSTLQAPDKTPYRRVTNAGGYYAVSVALGELAPLCSSSIYEDPIAIRNDEKPNSNDDASECEDDHDIRSIAGDLRLSSPTNDFDRSSINNDLHCSILQETSQLSNIRDGDSNDYDTISICAGEITLQHSQTSKSHKLSDGDRSPSPDPDYDTIPITDEINITLDSELESKFPDVYENTISKLPRCCNQENNGAILTKVQNEFTGIYEDTAEASNNNPLQKYPCSDMLENPQTCCFLDITQTVVFEKIKEFVTGNCLLCHFDISNCKLSDVQIAAVALALSKTSTLKHLNLSCNKITGDDTALRIASIIRNNLSLKSINLNDCYLQEGGIVIIAKALANITSLLSIDMSNNSITDSSTQSVATAVGENLLLEQLKLRYCFQYIDVATSEKGIKYILMQLTMFTYLKYLDLHSNYINEIASELLSVIIASNKSLSHLDLTNCKLPPVKLIAIATKLQSISTLKFLSLSSNVIVKEAAYEIAVVISNNVTLQHLALSDCELDERGFIDIAESLINISSLKHLDLSKSVITDEAATTLALGIANNMKLTYLNLSFCTWEDEGISIIHEVALKLLEFDIRL